MYDDLKDQNFEIVAAAQDTEGWAAAAEWYDQAGVTYTALVDVTHRVSSLYNLVNVPSGVWVDEDGRIVRINEGTYAQTHQFGSTVWGTDEYAPALRDWVQKGGDSEYVWAAGKVAAEVEERAPEGLAEPTFKLGVYFHQAGDEDRADRYWRQAQELRPDSWNYHRQDWSYTPDEAGENWRAKYQALEGKPYYDPLELDGPAAER